MRLDIKVILLKERGEPNKLVDVWLKARGYGWLDAPVFWVEDELGDHHYYNTSEIQKVDVKEIKLKGITL